MIDWILKKRTDRQNIPLLDRQMDMISDKEIDRLAKTHIYRKFHRKLSLKDIAVLGHIYTQGAREYLKMKI